MVVLDYFHEILIKCLLFLLLLGLHLVEYFLLLSDDVLFGESILLPVIYDLVQFVLFWSVLLGIKNLGSGQNVIYFFNMESRALFVIEFGSHVDARVCFQI